MPDRERAAKPKTTSRLSSAALAISVAAGCLLLAVLAAIGIKPNYTVNKYRPGSSITVVEDSVCRETERTGTPIGIVKEYTFVIGEELAASNYLAFYTVHQYVEGSIDGRPVYSL